ncbi:MAG: phosphopantothenoylcysteine decarboxylase [Verrucomicrobiota bacterium]
MSRSVLIIAGPAWEPIDQVRRITNHSTGALGSYLAKEFSAHDWEVTLAYGESSSVSPPEVTRFLSFSNRESLETLLAAQSSQTFDLVLMLAAVSDFQVRAIRTDQGELALGASGKVPTSAGALTLELEPTAKILPQLATWYPSAKRVGWKYEVEGQQEDTIAAGKRQLQSNQTHACVVNGPAYGPGFHWLVKEIEQSVHIPTPKDLFDQLIDLI